MAARKLTGRPPFGNPRKRSAATVWRMGASRRQARAERWTRKLVAFGQSTRCL